VAGTQIKTMEKTMNKLVRFMNDESGATAIEYGLIAAATGLALVAVMPTIKTKLEATFTSISGALS
jgi:pilus assembly protein Flp/PilA